MGARKPAPVVFLFLSLALAATPVACGAGASPRTDGAGVDAISPDAGASDGAPPFGDAPDDQALETVAPDGAPASDAESSWRSLFDGASLAAWTRYLGPPNGETRPLGLENDPRGVYTVVTMDGAPAIRISGEIWGSLISNDTFCNFHLRAQYKWGTHVWPPLNAFDSGIMYLSTGPLGAVNAGGPALSDPVGSGAFMVAVEHQLTHADVGGMYNLGPVTFATVARRAPTEPADVWNQVDIVVQDDTVTHAFNGVEVARGRGFVLRWPGQAEAPLRCGKLQLQSEGAEIFFRAVEIRALP